MKPLNHKIKFLKRGRLMESFWFTLVELIVVISILAILSTIAFLSFGWLSSKARDGNRISDVSAMKKALELFQVNSWKYPLPDNYYTVDYDNNDLWYQWKFWTTVVSNLSRNMQKVPTDPLTGREYIYSVTNNKNEYEILTLLEAKLTLGQITKASASTITVTPKIDWTYNGIFIKTPNYIIPSPSIINAEVDWINITLDATNITSQIITNWNNILKFGNINSNTWSLVNLNLSVYTWAITPESTDTEKENTMLAIQAAYTWSELVNNDKIKYILSKTTTEELVTLVNVLILRSQNVIKSSVPWGWEPILDFIFNNYTWASDGTAIQVHSFKPGQVGNAIKLNNNQALVAYNTNKTNAWNNYVKSISWDLNINNNLSSWGSSAVVYSSQQALYPSLSRINDTKAVFSAYENGPAWSEWLILRNLEVNGNNITQKTRNVGTTAYTSNPWIYTDWIYTFVAYGGSTMSLYTENNDTYTQRNTLSVWSNEIYIWTTVRKIWTNKYIAFLRAKLITFSVDPITYNITLQDTFNLPLHYTLWINQVSDTRFLVLYEDIENSPITTNHLLINIDSDSLSISEINTLTYPDASSSYSSSTMIEQNRFIAAIWGYLYETILNENTLSTQQIGGYEIREPLINWLIPLDNSKVLFFYWASDNTFKAKIMDLSK